MNEIKKAIKVSEISTKIINGVDIMVFGPPNAGKSTFFNIINKEEKSITTPIVGTTRDQIEASIDMVGHQVNLIDTAGVRTTKEKIEKIGIDKTKKRFFDTERLILVLSPDSLDEDYVKVLSKILVGLKKKKINYTIQ